MSRTLSSFVLPLAIAAVLSPPVVGGAAAQAPSTPSHVHYDTPAGFDAPAARALRAQDKGDEAAAIEARLKKAWRHSDVTVMTAGRSR